MNPLNERLATQSLLEQVLRKINSSGMRRIVAVHVAIGEMSELDRRAIQVQWEDLNRDTPAQGSPLTFRLIRAEVQCMACFEKYHPAGGEIHCPHCGSFGAKILSGEEFYLESID